MAARDAVGVRAYVRSPFGAERSGITFDARRVDFWLVAHVSE